MGVSRRGFLGLALAGPRLRVATFAADVTPPLGAPLCYGLVPAGVSVTDRLWARGVVLLPAADRPIVLCAVDWLGIGNLSRDQWLTTLAKAAGTVPERVALHTVHQHDAPGDDFSAQALLPAGVPLYDDDFALAAPLRVAAAVKRARAATVTSVTAGAAAVEGVASNRRILGPDGKVAFGRMTACRNSPRCAEPEGVIDPLLKSISFWGRERRIATLSCRVGGGALARWPPSAAQTVQTVFPYTAFTMTRSCEMQSKESN